MPTTLQEQLAIGLPLENLNVIVPWNATPDSMINYGKFDIKPNTTEFIWEEVEILGGFKVRLSSRLEKTLWGKWKVQYFNAYIYEEDVERLKQYLEAHLNIPPKYKTPYSMVYYYTWKLPKCRIRVGKGERFGFYHYISFYSR